MSGKKGGLGRGLGALIPTSSPSKPVENSSLKEVKDQVSEVSTPPSAPVDNSQSSLEGLLHLATVPLTSISANPRQPRQIFEPEALAELTASIKEVGLLQPPVVRALAGGKYELIMGERRLRASKEAGLNEITVIVKETADDDLLRDALLENLHRAQLNPLEEAAAYEQLLKDFGCTQEELATRIGRSRPQISNTLRLLKLPPTVAKRVAAGVLSAGHARALLSLSTSEEIERLATKIVAEGLSVRAVEEIVAMGGLEDEKKTRTKHTRPSSPRLAEISSRLSDQLDTRVKIELGRSKGKISIEFASIDDLERILGVIEK
ncbi:MAG: ParB/RepB/Spo0J family partition protein [Actinobacteria bacterium]|jgi:ParB family chromosome partitioning protein|nr:ParB/RepB/Spo0J family partition protein [Actinomycetota bacterium]NBP91011.1 ParB/RepB/Spo0J family partition protein [Actinomycetota bacterium]